MLRVRLGEEIELVDGKGSLAQATLHELAKDRATLVVRNVQTLPPPVPRIVSAIALMRMSKLEWTIEKCTELGADAFILFAADQSEKEDLSEHQQERLRHLSIAALKQCGRLYLPTLALLTLEQVLSTNALILFGEPDPQTPRLASETAPEIVFVTGPEKGFSKREREHLKQKGKGVRLNAHILRAETAPVCAISILRR